MNATRTFQRVVSVALRPSVPLPAAKAKATAKPAGGRKPAGLFNLKKAMEGGR